MIILSTPAALLRSITASKSSAFVGKLIDDQFGLTCSPSCFLFPRCIPRNTGSVRFTFGFGLSDEPEAKAVYSADLRCLRHNMSEISDPRENATHQ